MDKKAIFVFKNIFIKKMLSLFFNFLQLELKIHFILLFVSETSPEVTER